MPGSLQFKVILHCFAGGKRFSKPFKAVEDASVGRSSEVNCIFQSTFQINDKQSKIVSHICSPDMIGDCKSFTVPEVYKYVLESEYKVCNMYSG